MIATDVLYTDDDKIAYLDTNMSSIGHVTSTRISVQDNLEAGGKGIVVMKPEPYTTYTFGISKEDLAKVQKQFSCPTS